MSYSSAEMTLGRLLEAHRAGKLPHGLLFLGAEGSGRRQAAKDLAAAVFCETPDAQGTACGACRNCQDLQKGQHPDCVILLPEGELRQVKVEPVRELIARANLKPMRAPAQFFVIESAERMNETAQNAILKTLEEPQGWTHIILIATTVDSILPTVRSRLQTHRFTGSAGQATEDPEARALARKMLDFILYRIDGGRLGLGDGTRVDPVSASPNFSGEDRQTLSAALDLLIGHYREALLLRVGARQILPAVEEQAEKERIAGALSEEEISDRIETLSAARERVSSNISIKLAMAALWEEWAASSAR